MFGVLLGLLVFMLVRPFWQALVNSSEPARKFALSMRRWCIKLGSIALACLVLLLMLFYAEEDWSGKRAWENYKRQLEAQGEKLDWKDFIPPPVPDDQNFALTPLVASTYETYLDTKGHLLQPPDRNVVDRLDMNEFSSLQTHLFWTNGSSPFGEWENGQKINMKAWQACLRRAFIPTGPHSTNEFPQTPNPQAPAADVLLALSRYDSTIEELRQASRLPDSRFPLNYDADPIHGMILPPVDSLRPCIHILSLRASAELNNGQSEKALADVKLILYLLNSVRGIDLLYVQNERAAFIKFAIQPVWEGLVEKKWSADQLASIQRQLTGADLLSDYDSVMRGQRAMGLRLIEYERRTHSAYGENESHDFEEQLNHLYHRLFPQGWYYQNEVTLAQVYQQILRTEAEVKQGTLSPKLVQRYQSAIDLVEQHENSPYDYYPAMLYPWLGREIQRLAFQQNAIDLPCIACALERYHLKHGQYPETLNALVPEFMETIPIDVINGKPLHYRPTRDGKFLLYSVGWNETDDGGVPSIRDTDGEPVYADGDWVWPTIAQ